MGWIERLTPRDTDEVKPGLFIQKTRTGFRQVHPAAWNGKVNWKNFLWGGSYRHIIWFMILMLLVYSYSIETKTCKDFLENPCDHLINITNFCMNESSYDGFVNLSEVKYEFGKDTTGV